MSTLFHFEFCSAFSENMSSLDDLSELQQEYSSLLGLYAALQIRLLHVLDAQIVLQRHWLNCSICRQCSSLQAAVIALGGFNNEE